MYMTANSWVGLGPETTRSTSVAPAAYVPISSPQITPEQKFLRDEGMRGSPVVIYGDQIGVRNDKYSSKGMVFPDTFPHLLRAALGSTDTVASVGSLHSHTIGLFNSASVASQPPSYSLVDFDGAFAYVLTGSQLDSLSLSFKADGPMEYTANWITNPFASVAPPSETFSTVNFVPGWSLAASVGGSSVTAIADGQFDIKRKTQAVFGGGNQAPYQNFAGPIDVSGKLTIIMAAAAWDALTAGLTQAGLVLNTIFSLPGTTQPSVQLRCSQIQPKNPVVKRDKEYVEVAVNFDAEANTTDAVSGGYSPIWTQTVNGQTAAY